MKKFILKLYKPYFLLLLILILASFLRIWKMWEWPLNTDESIFSTNIFEIIKGNRPIDEPPAAYDPVAYTGQFTQYILLPSIFFFGNNLFFFRLPIVLVSIFSVLLLYMFARKYYNENVALFSAFILSIIPNVIINSSSAFEFPPIPFFILLSFYLFQRYAEVRKARYLYLFSFVSGLAIITRLTFFFFLIPFLLLLKFNPIIPFEKLKKDFNKRNLIFIFLFFLLGSFPFVFWNFTHEFATISFIAKDIPITYAKENLYNVGDNLFNGFYGFIHYLDKWFRWSFDLDTEINFLSIIFLLSLVTFILIPIKNSLKKVNSEFLRKNLYLLSIFFIILILKSTLTLSWFEREDYLMLYPFSSLIIGWSLNYAFNFYKDKKKIIFLAVFLLIFSYLIVNYLSRIQTEILKLNGDDCYKIVPELLKINEIKNSSLIVLDTTTYYQFFKFYEPKINSTNLVYQWYMIENFTKYYPQVWENETSVLLNDKVSYVFVKEECKRYWDKSVNITENFMKFLTDHNKTLFLVKNVSLNNNEILFRIYEIGGK